jgi:hypothetical protein
MKHKPLFGLLIFFMLILLLPIPIVSASWEPNGTPICTETGYQYYPDMCLAENGSVIITWQDPRTDQNDIYAQKINAEGEVQWLINGTPVCTETYYQVGPDICSNDAGGAIIVWYDWRGPDYDIYAQMLNGTGHPQWVENGIPICTESGDQMYPEVIVDGDGGAIIGWYSGGKIYAQKVNAAGVPQWGNNGTRVCLASSDQSTFDLCSDGNGGAIFAWRDNRGPGLNIYAQQINSTGGFEWDANGIPICTEIGDQEYPKLCSDAAGGAIIVWYDGRFGAAVDIYAQRINDTGDLQWEANGTAISTGPGWQTNPRLVEDGTGGAIIVWEVTGGTEGVHAQRINSDGTQLWGANGTDLCALNEITQLNPRICSDGANGSIVSWQDYRSGAYGIYAQRITAAGVLKWGNNGVAVSVPGNGAQTDIAICNTGSGRAIMAWQDSRNGNGDIYAQSTTELDFGTNGIPGFILLYLIIGFLAIISIYWRKRIN